MRKIIVLFVLLIASLVPTGSANASAISDDNCWKIGSFNAYSSVGQELDINDINAIVASGNEFKASRCRFQGFRIDVTYADTSNEFKDLKKKVLSKYRSPWLFCSTGNNTAYSINWTWHTKNIQVWKGEKKRYTKWALAWKKKNNCLRSR